jgi:hypothetical protein
MNIADLLRSSLFCSTENGLSRMHSGFPTGLGRISGDCGGAAQYTGPGGDARADCEFSFQVGLMVFGFWIALKVLHGRGHALLPQGTPAAAGLVPMVLLAADFTGLHLWLLMQPMIMRL